MIQILDDIDYISVLKEYTMIKSNLIWTDFGNNMRQCGLQYKENDDIWASAVGKNKDNENLYNLINPIISNTLFEKIILKFQLVRSRFLYLGPSSNYSMHRDLTSRIHLPIITNEQCFIVFKEGGVYHLQQGKIYETDTTKFHTAINCSEQWRLHFVGCKTC